MEEKPLRSLFAHLRKDQLLDLLVHTGLKIPDAAEEIIAAASTHVAHRRLFVRGLGYATTSATLRDAFSSYGEISEAAVIISKYTGNSRGFGFVTFRNMESVQRALEKSSMYIDGHFAVYSLATEGSLDAQDSANLQSRRLYVTGFDPDTTTEMLVGFLQKYGEIEEGAVVYDRKTNKSRGFGFVTYRMAGDAEKAVSDSDKLLRGCEIIANYAMARNRDKRIPIHQSVATGLMENLSTTQHFDEDDEPF